MNFFKNSTEKLQIGTFALIINYIVLIKYFLDFTMSSHQHIDKNYFQRIK
jgi:hypothetical protein